MDKFEKLEQRIYDAGVDLDFVDFESDRIKGLCCCNSIAISKALDTRAGKVCIAAEEFAHYQLTVGSIIDLTDVRNQKQEQKARLLAYNDQVGLTGLIKSYEFGCRSLSEIAEYLQVTDEFLDDAIKCYKSKYGMRTIVDNFMVKFEPSFEIWKMRD